MKTLLELPLKLVASSSEMSCWKDRLCESHILIAISLFQKRLLSNGLYSENSSLGLLLI